MLSTESKLWQSTDSKITFLIGKVTPKLKSITEPAYFAKSSAQLDKDGQFSMSIDLQSVNTNIEIRNQRLKDWFFETSKFPTATVTGKLDSVAINQMKIGDILLLDQSLVLNLHGQDIDIIAPLLISRTSKNKIIVNTRHPVILDVRQMNMLNEVSKLVEGMGLSSIWEQVPIFFYGEFTTK
ncbi:YceI family protein [Wielerella bovis]|uniref:YceI family protein n=1 Tax=Wielerella bovis TaxID=2917790 RepID=UPI002018860F|nr:YceI family protein [Wielerella bovis]MCG7656728.1 YceI family protein [Wielerella bovis]MCG7658951.1 YceI family protein [Wielerella bovis]